MAYIYSYAQRISVQKRLFRLVFVHLYFLKRKKDYSLPAKIFIFLVGHANYTFLLLFDPFSAVCFKTSPS